MAGQKKSKTEILKWGAIAFLVIAALFLHQHFVDAAWWVRPLIWVFCLPATVFLVLLTEVGRRIWQLARESRLELRRIVWPTRRETMQTTLVVAAMVTIMSLLLWSIDAVLLWTISILTGQKV